LSEAGSISQSGAAPRVRHAGDIAIASLVAAKARFLIPMVAIYMVGYIGLTVLAGFAPRLVALKVAGSLNLGFALIALNYLLSWGLALLYVRIANTRFDPMVAEVASGPTGAGGRR